MKLVLIRSVRSVNVPGTRFVVMLLHNPSNIQYPRHGPISSCPISVTETLVIEYMALPSDSPARAVIERRFGRANVLRLVAIYEEEQLNKKWIADSTMACPQCGINVEKSMGCNHMTCAKWVHFCYFY